MSQNSKSVVELLIFPFLFYRLVAAKDKPFCFYNRDPCAKLLLGTFSMDGQSAQVINSCANQYFPFLFVFELPILSEP